MRRATVALALGLIACNDAAAPGFCNLGCRDKFESAVRCFEEAKALARYRPPNWSLNSVPKRPAPTALRETGRARSSSAAPRRATVASHVRDSRPLFIR